MEIFEILSVEALLALMGKREGMGPYLVVNARHSGRETFVERLRAADVLVSDFDGMLHPGSQWADLGRFLPQALADDDKREAQAFFRLTHPTVQQEIDLLFRGVERFRRAELTRLMVGEAVRSATPRAGTKALVSSFRSSRVALVSYGIYDYIRAWTYHFEIPCDHIAALRLQWNTIHRLSGYDWQTAVVGSTKGFIAESFCRSIDADARRVLVTGDSPIDLSMMHPGNLGVLLVPTEDQDVERVAYRKAGVARMWPQVSAVFVSNTLEPLVELRKFPY